MLLNLWILLHFNTIMQQQAVLKTALKVIYVLKNGARESVNTYTADICDESISIDSQNANGCKQLLK